MQNCVYKKLCFPAPLLIEYFRNLLMLRISAAELNSELVNIFLRHSGLFVDPERAYTLSMKYYEEQQEKLAQQQKTAQNNTDGSGNPNGSDEDE